MDFKTATDELTASTTLEDVAREAGVSVQKVKQARLDPSSAGSRKPPAGWQGTVHKLAWDRVWDLLGLAKTVEALPDYWIEGQWRDAQGRNDHDVRDLQRQLSGIDRTRGSTISDQQAEALGVLLIDEADRVAKGEILMKTAVSRAGKRLREAKRAALGADEAMDRDFSEAFWKALGKGESFINAIEDLGHMDGVEQLGPRAALHLAGTLKDVQGAFWRLHERTQGSSVVDLLEGEIRSDETS